MAPTARLISSLFIWLGYCDLGFGTEERREVVVFTRMKF